MNSFKTQTRIWDQHSTKHLFIISVSTLLRWVDLYLVFFCFGYDLIISFLNSLLRIFKRHLSLNAILGHNFFSYPTFFLQFFLVALGIYWDSLVVFLFGYLLFHRFMLQMDKCPLLYNLGLKAYSPSAGVATFKSCLGSWWRVHLFAMPRLAVIYTFRINDSRVAPFLAVYSQFFLYFIP